MTAVAPSREAGHENDSASGAIPSAPPTPYLAGNPVFASDAEPGRPYILTTAFDSTPAADPSDDVGAIRAAKKYAESIIESVREPLLVLTPDLRVKTANPAFCRHFQVNEADILGTPVLEMGEGQWDIPALRSLLDDVLPEDHTFEEFEVRHDFGTLGPRVLLLNARRLDHVRLILLGIRDITQETRTKERLA